ncbi:MAG TPA: DUF6776 family protein [Gammaproteobacteria bacterium]
MSHVIIKQYKPYQIAIVVIALSLLISMTTWFYLDENHWARIKSHASMGNEAMKFMEENKALLRENQELKDRIIMLERTAQIDSQMAAELHDSLGSLQDEIYRLKGELEFYQGVMSSTSSEAGLNIQGMQVDPLPEEGNYRFRLILTHVTKREQVIEGSVDIALEGVKNGKLTVLNIRELAMDTAMDLSFKFRNFKRFEGNISIPEGFEPRRVIVNLQPREKKLSKIKRVFIWSEMVS